MKYLFLDIEWEQKKNKFGISENEMLEIAGISFTKDFVPHKKFSRLVRPKNVDQISSQTLKTLRLNRFMLEEAHPISEVLLWFQQEFKLFEIIIVWSLNTYELLIGKADACGIMLPKHKLVVLQDLMMMIEKADKPLSFENAMRKCGVEFDKIKLHDSRYDADCLKRLYCNIRYQYQKTCSKDEKYKCIHSIQSDILHNTGCGNVLKIQKEHLKETESVDLFEGMRPCGRCLQAGRFQKIELGRLNKEIIVPFNQLDEAYIECLCSEFQLEYEMRKRMICIHTGLAAWRIYYKEDKIISIYHENHHNKGYDRKKKKSNIGFHKQDDVEKDSLYGVLKYIKKHDRHHGEKIKNKKAMTEALFARFYKEGQEEDELKIAE